MQKLLVIIFGLFISFQTFSQSPDDYFHNSANLYIQGNKKEAKSLLTEAILKYPNDEKLRALISKIKDEKEEDQEQQQQQKQQKEQQQQQQLQQISHEDAERLLDEISREEKDVLKKVQLQKASVQKVPVDKNW